MKAFILSCVLLLPAISHARSETKFYTISTSDYMAPDVLAKACEKDRGLAAARLAEINERLLPDVPEALFVTSTHGRHIHSSGSSRYPNSTYEYYCLLTFRSEDAATTFKVSTATRITRIGRATWDTACDAGYEAAQANENSPISIKFQFWTLIQGRSCDVETVIVKKTAF